MALYWEVEYIVSILATVGQEMKSRSGVSAALFTSLAGAGINVKAIAQGCSEYNITAVIDKKDSAKALRAVHSRFYMTETPIAAVLVGPGLVGKTLLAQFHAQSNVLHAACMISPSYVPSRGEKKPARPTLTTLPADM